MHWLTAHIELKAVSLVLAVALWLYTSGQARVDVRVHVQVDPATALLPRDVAMTGAAPRDFHLVLSVPREHLGGVPSTIVPRIDLRGRGVRSGTVAIAVTPPLLGIDSDIRILRSEPPGIRELVVELDAKEVAAIPVRAPEVRGVPAGMLADCVVDQPLVRVRASPAVLDRLRRGGLTALPATAPATAVPADGERRERLVLAFAEPGVEVLDPVLATLRLTPIGGVRQRLDLAVHFALAPDLLTRWRVVPRRPRITVTVHGPETLLRELRSDQLTAYAVVADGEALPVAGGTVGVPVRVVGPPWLWADPATIEVDIAPVRRPATAAEPR